MNIPVGGNKSPYPAAKPAPAYAIPCIEAKHQPGRAVPSQLAISFDNHFTLEFCGVIVYFRALRRSMTACFRGVAARDYAIFQIYHRIDHQYGVHSVQAANIDEYIKQLPAGANLALMVQKTSARAGYWRPTSRQQMALPASTQKVITALAALIQLGPDFRFTTTRRLQRQHVDNGILKVT